MEKLYSMEKKASLIITKEEAAGCGEFRLSGKMGGSEAAYVNVKWVVETLCPDFTNLIASPCIKFNKAGMLLAVSTNENGIKILANTLMNRAFSVASGSAVKAPMNTSVGPMPSSVMMVSIVSWDLLLNFPGCAWLVEK
ncbi:CTLH, C-terminal LisH motif-containing protein [Artemisia annua]|uniref:CTLH, C-terminal LisH motif-containing protein n=1 Tax=Artemisia annua TaxID=35608 RepID=A0A2U1NVL3_ARTAN|nr:CTLH, C-terminal LisH motif-containing protein [Artemisia annua]